jgi:shikimate kinase
MAEKHRKNTAPPVGNVFLTGFMCAGKTLAGRALARALRRPFADTDALLARRHGASAAELIKRRGLGAFRRLEAALVAELAAGGGRIVALGGGFYPSGRRGALLKKAGVTVFLSCPWPELLGRLEKARSARPLLAGPWEKAAARARALYGARLPYYRRADLTVNVGGLSPARAAAKIAKELKP